MRVTFLPEWGEIVILPKDGEKYCLINGEVFAVLGPSPEGTYQEETPPPAVSRAVRKLARVFSSLPNLGPSILEWEEGSPFYRLLRREGEAVEAFPEGALERLGACVRLLRKAIGQ